VGCFSAFEVPHKLKILTENLIHDLLENLTLRIQKSTQQRLRCGSDVGWELGWVWTNLQFRGKIANLTVLSQICPDQMDIDKIFQNGSRGLISKICHNEEHYQIRHEESLNSSHDLCPKMSKTTGMTTFSCLYQIYIQTILKFINKDACCLFKFYFKF